MPPIAIDSIPAALETIEQLWQSGDFPAVDSLCRQILALDPHQVRPLHLLGMLEFRNGHPNDSIQFLTQALALAPAVRVCGIAPGITLPSGAQTEAQFARAWRAPPLGRSTSPEEIALAVKFILATPSMTGNILYLDGGESLTKRARDIAFESE